MFLHFKQIKSGEFELGEVHDRAIVRKKARTARDQKIVVELAKINAKLVSHCVLIFFFNLSFKIREILMITFLQ